MIKQQNFINECTTNVNSEMKDRMIAVDLDFKKSAYLNDGTTQEKVHRILTEDNARKNVRHFLNILNKKIYGNAAKRFNKKVHVVPVIKGGTKNNQLHLHMTVIVPERFKKDEFVTLMSNLWTKTHFGNSVMKVQDVHDLSD